MEQNQSPEILSAPWSSYQQQPEPQRTCRVCGCHDDDACIHPEHGNCWWVTRDLCSHCQFWPDEATRYSVLEAEQAAAGAFCD